MMPSFGTRRWTRKNRPSPRRLRLEPLEIRWLLSAVPLTADLPDIGTSPIEVCPNNTPPQLSGVPAQQSIPEMVVYSFTATASDDDVPAQTLEFLLRDAPDGALIDPDTGDFSWMPAEDQGPGQYTFWVQVWDDCAHAERELTLSVTEVNRAPVLDTGDWVVDELTALAFTVTASDDDLPANQLTYSVDDLPEGASFDPDTQHFSWTPSEAQGPGSYEVTFGVSDGIVSQPETIAIIVEEVNTLPVLASIGHQEVDELSTLAFSIAATDADLPENVLSFTASGLPDGASFDPQSQQFSWTPTETQSPGSYPVTFTVSDGIDEDSEIIQIQVARLNRPPLIELSNTVDTLAEDADTAEPIRVANIAIVDDGLGENSLGLSGQDASWFEIDAGGLYLRAGVVLDYETKPILEVTVQVDDSTVGSTPDGTAKLVISVTDVNLRPTGLGLSGRTVAENQLQGVLVGLLTTTDPEPPAEAFAYALVAGAGDTDNASFSIVGDRLETGEAFNYEVTSSYSIRLRTTDAGGLWHEQPFTITVTDVNDAPYLTASLADQMVFVGVALTYTLPPGVFADDDFGDFLTLSASAGDGSSLPDWLAFDGITLSGKPAGGDVGAVEVRVTATDSGNPPLQAEGFFTVTVSPHPRPWQNLSNPLDVNGDGGVTAQDVLTIINFMNGNGGGALPPPDAAGPPPFVDVSGDNLVTPLDVLTIINFLNQDPSAEGEDPGTGYAPEPAPRADSAELNALAALPTALGSPGWSSRFNVSRVGPSATAGGPVTPGDLLAAKQPADWYRNPNTASGPRDVQLARSVTADFDAHNDGSLAWDDLLIDLATDVAASHRASLTRWGSCS